MPDVLRDEEKRISPTFREEYDTGTYSGYYKAIKAFGFDPNAEYLHALTLR